MKVPAEVLLATEYEYSLAYPNKPHSKELDEYLRKYGKPDVDAIYRKFRTKLNSSSSPLVNPSPRDCAMGYWKDVWEKYNPQRKEHLDLELTKRMREKGLSISRIRRVTERNSSFFEKYGIKGDVIISDVRYYENLNSLINNYMVNDSLIVQIATLLASGVHKEEIRELYHIGWQEYNQKIVPKLKKYQTGYRRFTRGDTLDNLNAYLMTINRKSEGIDLNLDNMRRYYRGRKVESN